MRPQALGMNDQMLNLKLVKRLGILLAYSNPSSVYGMD